MNKAEREQLVADVLDSNSSVADFYKGIKLWDVVRPEVKDAIEAGLKKKGMAMQYVRGESEQLAGTVALRNAPTAREKELADSELRGYPLQPYQKEAIEAVRNRISAPTRPARSEDRICARLTEAISTEGEENGSSDRTE